MGWKEGSEGVGAGGWGVRGEGPRCDFLSSAGCFGYPER
jgi:hypothetical protein